MRSFPVVIFHAGLTYAYNLYSPIPLLSAAGAVVCVLTGEAWMYNTKLTLLFLFSVIAAAGVLTVLFGGLFSVLRGILYVFLYNILYAKESSEVQYYCDPELSAGEFRKIVYGESKFLEMAAYIFLVLTAFLLAYVIPRKQNVVRKIAGKIRL